MKIRLIALLVGSFLTAPSTWAAAAEERPFSVGVSAGWSSMTFDDDSFTSSGLVVGSLKKTSQAWGINAAYQIDPMWSVEAAWNSLGYMTARGVSNLGNWTANIHVENWTVGPAATFSLTDKIGAVVRVGILSSDNQFGKTGIIKTLVPDQQQSTDYYLGAGIKFAATDRIGLSLNVNYYHQLQKTTTVSGGLHWMF